MILSKMVTKHLLSEYRKLKKIRDEFKIYMCEEDEIDENVLAQYEEGLRLFKAELKTRENIPTKAEAKAERQRKAKKNKGGRRSHKKK